MKGNRVNPPLQLKLPQSIANDRDLKKAFDDLTRVVDQLWRRTGAGDDLIQNERLHQLFSFTANPTQAKKQENFNVSSKKASQELNYQVQKKTSNTQINLTRQAQKLENVTITDVDITTTEGMTIMCNNDALDINITLNDTPEDNEIVFIKKLGSKNVNINAVKLIDGKATKQIAVLYESLMIRYIGKLDQWFIT